MKRGYAIILVVFCFSLMSSVVDELDIFDQSVHVVGVSTADIEEMNASLGGMVTADTAVDATPQSFDIFATFSMLAKGVKIILIAFGKTVLIYPTMIGYGTPEPIAGMIQGIVTFVEVVLMVEFMTGRRLSQ